MIFDCVFLHRNVLEAVTSPSSPRRFPTRFSRGRRSAGAGLGSRCSSCCSSCCPLQRGPCGAGIAAGGTSVAQVAGAGHGDVPWPGWGWRWRGGSSSRTRRVHKDWETGVLVLFIPCTFHRHENWKRWNLWGKSNFPFLLNGFSLILTWFYHVPVEGLRVYTVC